MSEYELLRIIVEMMEVCAEYGGELEECAEEVARKIERAWDNARSQLGA